MSDTKEPLIIKRRDVIERLVSDDLADIKAEFKLGKTDIVDYILRYGWKKYEELTCKQLAKEYVERYEPEVQIEVIKI